MTTNPLKKTAAIAAVAVLSFGFGAPLTKAANIEVNSNADTTTAADGECTLREAITNANSDSDTTSGDCTAGSGADTISFDIPGDGPHTVQLGGPLPDLAHGVSIANDSGKSVTVQRDTGGDYRIFHITADADVTMSDFAIANGVGPTTDDRDPAIENGGGIRNDGTLLLKNMWIHDNSASADGTRIGGGVWNLGTLTAINSTFSDNAAYSGAGLSTANTATLTNCTVSQNHAQSDGGGIAHYPSKLTVTSCTVAHNDAGAIAGGIAGGYNVTLTNTIVGDNTAENYPDIRGEGTSSGGYNLIETTPNPADFTAGPTDIIGVDPHLGPLGDNGGPTLTHALLGGSPAIDAGKNFATDENDKPIAKDQRGFTRPVDQPGYANASGASDIGAFEVQASVDISEPTVTIEQAPNQSDPTSASTIRFIAKFSEPVTGFDSSDVVCSNPFLTVQVVPVSSTTYQINVTGMKGNSKVTINIPQDVAFDTHGDGNAASTGDNSVIYSITNQKAAFEVNSTADTDDGSCDPLNAGDPNLDCTLREAIDAANTDRGAETITFALPSASAGPAVITLKSALPPIATGMTIKGPGAELLNVTRSGAAGTPAFRIFLVKRGVTASIQHMTISNGDARPNLDGGGILNRGILNVVDCIFRRNHANSGGGIGGDGRHLEVRKSTFSQNFASSGGALTALGSLLVANSTFSENGAKSAGGIYSGGQSQVVNSTFAANDGGMSGGAILIGKGSNLSAANCTFSGNTSPHGGDLLIDDATADVGNTIFNAAGARSIEVKNAGGFTSDGYNLTNKAAGGNHSTGPGGLLNATGDQRNTDPKLGPLQDNGGPTATFVPAAHSPAIDKGKNLARSKSGQPIGKDQRGEPRPVRFDQSIDKPEGGDGSDIGAVERKAP